MEKKKKKYKKSDFQKRLEKAYGKNDDNVISDRKEIAEKILKLGSKGLARLFAK